MKTINTIKNPLTIIAVFAGIAEVSGTTVLPFIEAANQLTFIYFLITFPLLLVLFFFLTLNFNNKVLYAPSDFRDDKSFIATQYGLKGNMSSSRKYIANLSANRFASASKKSPPTTQKNKKIHEKGITSSKAPSIGIPVELLQEIVKWITYPAYLPIIYAIVYEQATSISQLKNVEVKYNLPNRWATDGLDGFNESILHVDDGNITIGKKIEEPLKRWLELNNIVINDIIDCYENPNNLESTLITDRARNYSQRLSLFNELSSQA